MKEEAGRKDRLHRQLAIISAGIKKKQVQSTHVPGCRGSFGSLPHFALARTEPLSDQKEPGRQQTASEGSLGKILRRNIPFRPDSG